MTEQVSGFLWFPKTINGELRWLTYNTWERLRSVTYDGKTGSYIVSWVNVRWIDPIEPVRRDTGLNPFVNPY